MKNNPIAGAARQQLPVVAKQLGITLPKPVAAALERHRNPKPLNLPPAPSTATMVTAIRAATDNGIDPAADPEIQRLLAARQLAPLAIDPTVDQLDGGVDDCIAAHAETIVADLGAAIDRDGATLTDAHRQLGNIDLDQPGIANTLTDTQAATWVRARDARNRIQEARKLWRLLVAVARLAAVNPHRHLCEITAPSLDQYQSLPNDADAWDAVRAALTISSAVPATEYEHRSQAIDAEHAAEQAEQQQAASRGLRFTR